MITTTTPQQWAEIEALRERVIASVCEQPADDRIREVVHKMWGRMNATPQAVLIFDCPITAAMAMAVLYGQLSGQLHGQLSGQLLGQLYDQLGDQLGDQLLGQLRGQLSGQLYGQLSDQLLGQLRGQLSGQLYGQLSDQLGGQLHDQLHGQLYGQLSDQLGGQLLGQLRGQLRGQLYKAAKSLYVSVWWRAWSGWFEGGKVLGTQFDRDKYDLFLEWTRCVPVIIANGAIPIVSRFPEQCHWRGGRLHNDKGMSVRFRSGWGLWTIDGIPVDEQIVKRPETQTVRQIDGETNADVRSIRINRFGWPRYLKDIGAKPRHESTNHITGCPEALYRTPDGEQRLVVVCPTGRTFAIGVPSEIETCEAAQKWLGPAKGNCIAAT